MSRCISVQISPRRRHQGFVSLTGLYGSSQLHSSPSHRLPQRSRCWFVSFTTESELNSNWSWLFYFFILSPHLESLCIYPKSIPVLMRNLTVCFHGRFSKAPLSKRELFFLLLIQRFECFTYIMASGRNTNPLFITFLNIQTT